MDTRRTKRVNPFTGPKSSPTHRMSSETTSSDQPLTPSETTSKMDPPAMHEHLDGECRTHKRVRSSPFNSPFGSSAFEYGLRQSQTQVNSGTKSRELTDSPMPRQAPQGTIREDPEIVKLRAELSQLRLDFDLEKQQNESMRSQFDVERCLNEFLRGQTIAEQCVNKSLMARVAALEERMNLQEPTFVTLQSLKQVLLTWLRDHLVNNKPEERSGPQQEF
ncbi:hypothetical protein PENDEC_c002G00989 [Penicillium decumbens]|uniref:Uncharacterized protein n=1 Tax=Penicillium decumbens TaxID=69771 RepID=A0A1V6PMS9_PENDC|nr:hypothetical protein PENDEC_c002G00989 [Penicillium decumbens]